MRENTDTVKFIKDTAKKIGFDGCGIASPVVLEKDVDYLLKWLSENKHGNIKYLEKNIEQKADIRKLSGNAKSVIALVQNYYPSKKQNEDAGYRIAKYAFGNDYHAVIKTKAAEFIQALQKKIKNAEFKIFIDSNSILEKAWAARCGLGWIGKNTLLINHDLGSFMFICIILTDLVLDYDEMHEDNCGNCNACISACPVGAIEKPYQLNASKCIANQTIENTSIKSQEENGNTEGWIYGCDICQDACPWNKDIPASTESAFMPNPELLKMKKSDWEKLDEEKFNKLFKKSAVKRIGFKKLKKNIENAKATNNISSIGKDTKNIINEGINEVEREKLEKISKGVGIGKYDKENYEVAIELLKDEFSNEKIIEAYTKEEVKKLASMLYTLKEQGIKTTDLCENDKVSDYLTNLSAKYKNKK